MSTTVLYLFFLSCCFIHLIRNTHGIVTSPLVSGPDEVTEGGNANYTCSGKCSNGTCSYSITYPRGTVVASFVQWKNIKRQESPATVVCSVTDNVDKGKGSSTKSVKIQYPPTVTLDVTDDTLVCRAVGGNPANYIFHWRQTVGDVVVREKNFSPTITGVIEVPLVADYSRRGNYTCGVSNGIGERVNKTVFDVQFNHAPLIVSARNAYNVSKGDPLTTTFDVYAYPDVTSGNVAVMNSNDDDITKNLTISTAPRRLTVEFNGKQVSVTGTRISVTYPVMTELFFYKTAVAIKNTKGTITSLVDIHPKGPPDVPTDFAVSGATHDSITVSLTSGFFNGANQTLNLEYKGSTSGNWTSGPSVYVGTESGVHEVLTVIGLDPETLYMVRAFAQNAYDRSSYTDATLEVSTWEVPISMGAIAGIIVGSLVGVVMIIIIVLIIYKWRSRRHVGDDSKARYEPPNLQLQDIMACDNDIYVNEEGATAPIQETIPHSTSAENYMNTPFQQGVAESNSPDSPSVENYMNTTFQRGIGENNNPDSPSTENYMNTTFQQGIGENNRGPVAGACVQSDVSGSNEGLPLYFEFSAGKPTEGVQSDVGGSQEGLPLYFDLSSGGTQVNVLEDNYMNIPDSGKPPASEKKTAELDDIYLDMEVPTDVAVAEAYEDLDINSGVKSKQSTKGGNILGGNSQYPKADTPEEVLGESYENVAQFKKDKPDNKSSNTRRIPRLVTSASIPEQQAPPPPTFHPHLQPMSKEPHYINFNVAK